MVEAGVGRPSWIAILILAAAMIMPGTPRRTLISSVVAASMGPVAMIVAALAGRDVPPLGALLVIYLPNSNCVVNARPGPIYSLSGPLDTP